MNYSESSRNNSRSTSQKKGRDTSRQKQETDLTEMMTFGNLPYKDGLSKNDYMNRFRKKLIYDIAKLYKDPETAFANFNFSGKNSISMHDILNHKFIRLCNYDVADVKSFLLREKVFKKEDDQLNFLNFKKYFFPKLMLIADTAEGDLVKQEDELLN